MLLEISKMKLSQFVQIQSNLHLKASIIRIWIETKGNSMSLIPHLLRLLHERIFT